MEGDGLYLSPGFIDIHIHGSGGYDTMDCTYESINEISKIIAICGTTSFIPTTMTFDSKKIKKAIEIIAYTKDQGTGGANVLGVHLEGPFINAEVVGAHNPNYVLNASIQNFKNIVGDFEKTVTSVTLAPEIDDSKELINYLHNRGIVVSMGHTNATYEEAMEGIKLGVSHSTHIFNAMSSFHHRSPGVIGAIFDSNITTEVIADGILVSYPALRMVCNQKKLDNIIIVTDAIMPSNMNDGEYLIGEDEIVVSNGSATLKSGTLAGSITMLNKAVRNIYENTDYSLHEIIKMVTFNPAKYCKVEKVKGTIKEGFDADIIIFDKDINIMNVIINGQLIK